MKPIVKMVKKSPIRLKMVSFVFLHLFLFTKGVNRKENWRISGSNILFLCRQVKSACSPQIILPMIGICVTLAILCIGRVTKIGNKQNSDLSALK
jgi:hypothetical protein